MARLVSPRVSRRYLSRGSCKGPYLPRVTHLRVILADVLPLACSVKKVEDGKEKIKGEGKGEERRGGTNDVR